MKRTFEQMSEAMAVDTGVRKRPRLSRQSRMTRIPGTSLTSKQRAQVQNLIRASQELKYIVFNSGASTAISSTINISQAPFVVAQGLADTERVGDSLTLAGSVNLDLEIVNSTGVGSDAYNNLRVVIFQWHPNSTPIGTSIFINGPSGGPDIYSQYNHDLRQQYKILFDRTFRTAGNGQAATSPYTDITSTGLRKFFISLKRANKHVQFAGAGTTGTNLLYVALVSDSSATPHPAITYSTKMFWRDG